MLSAGFDQPLVVMARNRPSGEATRFHREIADADVTPFRRDAPAVGEERDAIASVAGPDRRSRSGLRQRRQRRGRDHESKHHEPDVPTHPPSLRDSRGMARSGVISENDVVQAFDVALHEIRAFVEVRVVETVANAFQDEAGLLHVHLAVGG
jgi:hypothetical protein